MEKKEMTISEINEMLGTDYPDKGFFLNYISWDGISVYSGLSEDFIREFRHKLNWIYIAQYQVLSEDFIREFQDNVDWVFISMNQKLSEDFIREFQDKVDWYHISRFQKLSESFIREFWNKLNWDHISTYQKLSEDFIRELQDKTSCWYYISKYQKLSPEFCQEFSGRLNFGSIDDNWIYKDTEFKKKMVMDTKLYECHEDYFIAYKGIRRDRYSKYNFQYRYLKGETYSAWCDCSWNENSFGLSVWTEKDARNYCDELVVKVKVNYSDVGRVVHRGGKIRCFKIEILD